MASVFQRRGRWYLRVKDGTGSWKNIACEARTKTEAKALAGDLAKKFERQRLGLEPAAAGHETITLGELLDWWWREYGVRLRSPTIRQFAEKHLRPTLGAVPLREVGAKLEGVLNAKTAELSPESLNHLRALVHRVFSVAARRGLWQGTNPASLVPRFKVPKRVPDYLKTDEVPRLLSVLDEWWRPLFACAVYTGMRKGELLALRKSDIDMAAGTITVARSHSSDTTKGGRAAVLPVAEELRPYLAAALAASTSELVFPRADGGQHPPDVALHKVLRRALGRAGIVSGYILRCGGRCGCGYEERRSAAGAGTCPRCGRRLWLKPMGRKLRFHHLRHTTATLLLKAGVPLATVQRILRHSDPTITAEVYGHLDLDDMREGINRLQFGAGTSSTKNGSYVRPVASAPTGRGRSE